MAVRPFLISIRSMGVGAVLGLAACVAAPRIVGPLHTPIPPSQVVVFDWSHVPPPFIPKHYTVIAKLDATGYGGCSSSGTDRIILAELRKQAARLGANGVLLIPDRHFQSLPIKSGPYGGSCSPSPPVGAKAIYYVPRLKSKGGA